MSRKAMKQVMSAVAGWRVYHDGGKFASAKNGNNTKPLINTTMSLYNSAFLEGHELKAGDYNVTATDTVVTISKNHKSWWKRRFRGRTRPVNRTSPRL